MRRRNNGRPATHGQAVGITQQLTAAITLLDWLTAHHLDLGSARQGDLDTWLTSEHVTGRRAAGHFVRWAKRQKLTTLDFPATKWAGPNGDIDGEARWQQARRLLHEHQHQTRGPRRRAARPALRPMARNDQPPHPGPRPHHRQHLTLRLGREPVDLPEPLAALVQQLTADRRGHATLGDPGTSPWLCPGGRPGQPISPAHMTHRLRQLGLNPGQDRSSALFHLATELPAALLARLLGITIGVAVAWQRASNETRPTTPPTTAAAPRPPPQPANRS